MTRPPGSPAQLTIQPFTEDGHILMKKQTDFHEEDMKALKQMGRGLRGSQGLGGVG